MSNYFLPAASTKANLKNADVNDPTEVIDKIKSKENFQLVNVLGNDTYNLEEVAGFVHFKMYRYVRGRQERKYFSDGFLAKTGRAIQDAVFLGKERNDETDYKGVIILPLLSGINMGYGVNWSTFQSPLRDTFNAMNLTPRSLVQDQIAKYQSKLADVSATTGTSSPVREAAADGAMAATQQLDNQAANEAGLVFNPDDELVLEGIDLRTHSFEFLLTPRNAKEKASILTAIQLFKVAALPSKKFNITANSAAGLDYPYEFSIYFMDARTKNDTKGVLEIPIIPDCALVDINVTYNPMVNKFHLDGSPVQYRISLTFREHQTLTADDIIEGGF